MIPKHVAIIMDGNRRWAREHHLPVLEGHRRVANEVLEKLVEHAADRGVSYLTVWAFSTENWGRERNEVRGIMRILREGLKRFGEKMHKRGVRIQMIGDITRFDPDIQHALRTLFELTKNNTRITIVFALNYGGRDEIVRAIMRLHENSKFLPRRQAGETRNSKLTVEEFSRYMDTAEIPDPELIIRTSGERRLSGFLLWQSEYSELYFAPWHMPDFTPLRFDEALEDFSGRKRRFGK